MNSVDIKFNSLIEEIKNKSLEEIYNNIRMKFDMISPNIKNSLEDYFKKFPYWGKLNQNEGDYEELYNRAKSLKEHVDDYNWLYNHLEDYRSKKVLFAILNNWYEFDFDTLKTSAEKNYSHYFDLDLIKCTSNEVIVDLGAYTGDTILDYLNCYGIDKYKKIYCYEVTSESCAVLRKNLEYYPNIEVIEKAVSDKKEILYLNKSIVDNSANTTKEKGDIKIEAVTIDEDIKDKITMIKMDIEGSEQKALLGCKKHIQKEHPKLLISVYHNHEDLWKIPTMIEEMTDKYKYHLRYYGNNIFPTEIVLIATN